MFMIRLWQCPFVWAAGAGLLLAGAAAAQRPEGRGTNPTEEARRQQQQLKEERQRRLADALRDVDRSGTPPRGEIEFDRNWRERIAKRSAGPAMTAKEKAIFKALASGISVKFQGNRLDDVIEAISDRTGVPVLIDKKALDEAQVTYDTQISLSLKNVTVRTVLKKILGDLGLTYVIKDETIQVVTPIQAREMLVVRHYPIGDMVVDPDPRVTVIRIAQLIDLIQRTVEPQSWQVNGGPGTIAYYGPTMSLVIKQSAEFHGVVMGGAR